MNYLSAAGVTHVSYILILFSISFLLYLFVNILLTIYANAVWPGDESNGQRALADQQRKQITAGRAGHIRNVSFQGGGPGRLYHQRRQSSMPNSPFLDVPDEEEELKMNGYAAKPAPRLPKKHQPTDSQQVRDAEEFELEGLISDVDEDAPGVDSPKEKRQTESV